MWAALYVATYLLAVAALAWPPRRACVHMRANKVATTSTSSWQLVQPKGPGCITILQMLHLRLRTRQQMAMGMHDVLQNRKVQPVHAPMSLVLAPKRLAVGASYPIHQASVAAHVPKSCNGVPVVRYTRLPSGMQVVDCQRQPLALPA